MERKRLRLNRFTCLGFLLAPIVPAAWGIGTYLGDHGVLPDSFLSAFVPALVVMLIALTLIMVGDRR